MASDLDNGTRQWDELAKHLEAFVESWEQGDAPPLLQDHLPNEPPLLRCLTLVELIKVDMEYRGKGDAFRNVESYAEQFAEIFAEEGPPPDLIYEEYHVLKSAGREVSAAEYISRFPAQAEALRRMLELEEPAATTVITEQVRLVDVEPGQTIDDFFLQTRLGKGAFGSVYLARQESMQRMVALKITANRGIEGQTLAQLEHPYIVRVYDQRIVPQQNARLLYMQYVSGGTLQEVIKYSRAIPFIERDGAAYLRAIDECLTARGETPPIDSWNRRQLMREDWQNVVCRVGSQLAQALDYAHQRGILHRDIKPANVLVAADGTPKLADFNISFSSKLDGAAPAAYFGGSMAYMSPEQLEACSANHSREPEDLDSRSDLYSLGVLLWEVLHGQRAYVDESFTGGWAATLDQMAKRRREEPPVPPEHVGRPENLDGVQRVLEKCLASDPDDRYSCGNDLSRELALCMQPHARKLLSTTAHDWRWLVKRLPFLAFLFVTVTPHVFAAIINEKYNKEVLGGQPQEILDRFYQAVFVVNAIAFPLGIGIVYYLFRPVGKALRSIRRGAPTDLNQLIPARRSALRQGFYAGVLGMTEWLLAGLVYPLYVRLDMRESLHIGLSLVVCGLIAGAYPFFCVMLLSMRV